MLLSALISRYGEGRRNLPLAKRLWSACKTHCGVQSATKQKIKFSVIQFGRANHTKFYIPAYGYDIYEVKVNRSRHFFNKTPSGEIVDFTAEQFSEPVDYTACRLRNPKDLHKSCNERLTILKSKIDKE